MSVEFVSFKMIFFPFFTNNNNNNNENDMHSTIPSELLIRLVSDPTPVTKPK